MDEWIRKLSALAGTAPSADNCQPWTLRWDGSDLEVSFAPRDQAHPIFGASSHATLMSVGALVENLETTLQRHGVVGAWWWGSHPEEGHPYVSVAIKDVPRDFVTPVDVLGRHTNRLAYRENPLPPDVVAQLENSRENGNRTLLLLDRPRKKRLIRLVRLSAEARFSDRDLHEGLIESLRFTPEAAARGDGLDVRTLGLPPGGKHFLRGISDWRTISLLNRVGAYKLLAHGEGALLSKGPAIMCIVGGSDARSAIDAGRLMTRIWIGLNAKGIAVHPYYVVADQLIRLKSGAVTPRFESKIAGVEAEIRQLLALQSNEILHMILRVGYPTAEPLRSKRLPLGAIFVDDSQLSSASQD